MPRHEWMLIENPDDSKFKKLISDGAQIYHEAFEEDYRIDYDDFSKYAKDTFKKRTRKFGADVQFIDMWYLGIADGDVKGFLFFTVYKDSRLGVIDYLTASNTQIARGSKRILTDQCFRTISSWNIGHFYQVDGYLLELERISPEQVRLSKQDTYTKKKIDRLQRLARIYGALGAHKIPGILYKQPSVNRSHSPVRMHLLYLPRVRHASRTISVGRVRSLVEFMYKQFYYDAYPSEMAVGPNWKEDLGRLCEESMRFLPHEANFELRKNYYNLSLSTVFVSYANADVLQAGQIAMWLNEQCIETFFWEDSGRWSAPRPVLETIREKLDLADAIIFLITTNTEHASGQREEIEYSVKQGMEDKMHIISYLSANDTKALCLPTERIYYPVKSETEFFQSVEVIIDKLTPDSWPGEANTDGRRN